mmetsp:Transcript_97792/g.305005  ORF Transcript_97792/g.305005 Transcript_97792/m.305005 type:complete len:417 (+) Transcript_97792:47-1297(+)
MRLCGSLCTLIACTQPFSAVHLEATEGPCEQPFEEASARPLSVVAGIFGRGGWSAAGGVATSMPLYLPRGLAVEPGGQRLFLADTANHAIRLVDLVTGASPVLAGSLGQCGASGDLGPSAAAQLCRPHGVALDPVKRHLFIADSQNHAVRRLELPAGTITSQRTHVGSAGNLVDSGSISSVVGVLGSRGHSGDGGPPDKALLNFPMSVAVDPHAQRLYVADSENHVIRLVELSLGIIATIAGVAGVPGSLGDGGPAISAQLNHPMGMAVGASQNLYVADNGNHVVRHVDLVSGFISTVVGARALPGSSGDGARDGSSATAARLRYPNDLALDTARQHLYVAGASNPAIRRVDLTSGSISTALARPGLYVDTGDGGPVGLGLDQDAQRLFVSEAYNHVVRSVDLNFSAIASSQSLCH